MAKWRRLELKEIVCEETVGEIPAQFTSEEGEGRDLYACQSSDAVFARLLYILSPL